MDVGREVSFFDGYEALDGLPVRILKPSENCLFTCFAFSDNGKHMTTGEDEGTIKLWSTKDYTLLNHIPKVFEKTVFSVKFVSGTADTIIAIDDAGHVKEFKIISIGHEKGLIASSNPQIQMIREIDITQNSLLWSHFSSDGRTLVYECKEKSTTINICTFNESSMDRSELSVDKEFRKFPVLSNDGKRLFVLDLAEDDYDWKDFHPTIRVWNDVTTKEEPALLPGDRAVWGPDGEHIAALWSDKTTSTPFIAIYKTRDLIPGRNNQHWMERKPSFDISSFQAQILPRHHHDNDVKILMCEVGVSQVRRFVVWNVTKNKIKNEIEMTVNMQRSLNMMQIFIGPRIMAHGNASLSAGMVEEADWAEIDAAGYMLVAEQDVYPKFCISKDEELIAAFSWRHHSCSIVSKHSGVTMCSFTLPEDITLDPTFMLNTVQFDPAELHVVLFGDEAICVCSPSLLCVNEIGDTAQLTCGDLRSTMFPGGSGADVADSLVSNLDHSVLSEEALFRLTSGGDDANSEKLKEKTARLVHILADEQILGLNDIQSHSAAQSSQALTEEPILRTRTIEAVDSRISYLENRITRAFLFKSGDDYGIYFVHDERAVIYEGQDARRLFKIDSHKCFAISSNEDRASMMILDREGVGRVDLSREEVVERFQYKVNFGRLIDRLRRATKWTRDGKWDAVHYSCRCISDDGQKVLLGWDTKNRRSITVTPETEEAECISRIEESNGSLSDFCCLSRDGRVTTFADTDDLTNGRLTVGIYDETGGGVVVTVRVVTGVETEGLDHEDLCALLHCFFFDVTRDCSKIVTLIAGDKNIRGSIKDDKCIRTFSPWARDGFVPDYSRLTEGTYLSRADAVKEAVGEFRFDNVFNTQHSRSDDPILAKAIANDDDDLANGIFELAKRQNCQTRLDWKSSNENDPVDLIKGAILDNDAILIKKILTLIGSGIFPFIQAAKAVKKHMRMLLKRYPEIMENAFLQDHLLVEIGQLKVLPDYLNVRKRSLNAIHISTTDNVIEWKLDENPDGSEKRWSHIHHDEVEEMKKGVEYHPRVIASLKAVCFDNAAGIGMKGIIRPLLMRTQSLSADIFKSTAIKSVVLFKLYKIWESRFKKCGLRYLVFLAVFAAYAIMVGSSPDISEESRYLKTIQLMLLVWIFFFGLSMSFEEVRQVMEYTVDGWRYLKKPFWGIKFFLSSRWNWIDVSSCLLLMFFIPLFHGLAFASNETEDWLSGFIAAEAVVASIKVWYFAQPFRKSGALVLMVENIVKDCLVFLLLAFFILFGFSLALHVLFRKIVSGTDSLKEDDAKKVDDAFGSFKQSLHTMFYAMVGQFEPETYSHGGNLSWLIKGTFSVYMITQMILLLNLLIAIMGDTFDKVKNREEAEMLLGRASIIDACEAGLTMQEVGRYLQFLEPVDDDGCESTEWIGKIQVLERTLKKSFKENERMVKDIAASLEERLEETSSGLEKRMDETSKGLETRIGGLESKMEEMDRRIGDNLEKLFTLIEHQKRG